MTAGVLLQRADALLVDLDGTLIDSSAPVRRAWEAFADRHGLDPDEVERFAHGRPSRESIRSLAPDTDQEREATALEEAELGDTEGVTALPGALELLGSGRRLAIVTSCSTALAETRLRAAGLPIPSILVSSDGLEHGKPDPSCFFIGARRLGVEPARCVVLEDAPAGIRAGRDAGARVIAVRTTHGDQDLAEADSIVDDLRALLATAARAA
ncbi:MAG TPA: HAD-IA family hydrolase [Solirubrobacteraceae bacterium]